MIRFFALLGCLALLAASCKEPTQPDSGTTGRIHVHVYWQDAGVPDIRIAVMGTSLADSTNQQGNVDFDVAPGQYVVRAYDINRGGPCCGYVDSDATVLAGETTNVEVWDCLACALSVRQGGESWPELSPGKFIPPRRTWRAAGAGPPPSGR